MINPVEIVTITVKYPLIKKGTGEEATNIELINFSFLNGEECGFNVVSQKDLYQIGDKALYIQPDYCVPDTKLFSSFITPNGDPKKSKLGRNNRIRAIKFNFTKENSSDVIYSNGILLPENEVDIPEDVNDLAEFLNITKYEEPEKFGTGNTKGNLPGFLYKTDEENSANLKSYINRLIESGESIGYSLKIDGSSFSLYVKEKESGLTVGVCSRVLEKKDADNPSNEDRWVKLAHSTGLYEKALRYNRQLAFRGEIYGSEVTKGSGNKQNPHSKLKSGLSIFGIDDLDLSGGYATKLLPKEVESICKELELEYVTYTQIFPKDYNHLVEIAEGIFNDYEINDNWAVEGIIVRTLDSNNLSCKVMNQHYDSKK